MDIGRRICQHRKALGYTQQKLAEMSNQEPSNISHIERGATKLGLPTLVSIAEKSMRYNKNKKILQTA